MAATTNTTISIKDLFDFGHNGKCDHRSAVDWPCGALAVAVIAEATPPQCTCGVCDPRSVSLALYCAEHLGSAPMASQEALAVQAERQLAYHGCPGPWQSVAAAWPQPVALDHYSYLAELSCYELGGIYYGEAGAAEEIERRGRAHVEDAALSPLPVLGCFHADGEELR